VNVSTAVLAASGTGQDRMLAVPTCGGWLLAVADGAGNSGAGADAADSLISFISGLAPTADTVDLFDALIDFDDEQSRRRSGETTGVVAFVKDGIVRGASVGDSEALLVSRAGGIAETLTQHQRRRPLLGSGEALPVIFEADLADGRLLLATDGLVKYASLEQVCALVNRGDVDEAAEALAESVRLPNGSLQDDVAVVVTGV
jgi:serine/threonine protein phosphatase PrpC